MARISLEQEATKLYAQVERFNGQMLQKDEEIAQLHQFIRMQENFLSELRTFAESDNIEL